MAAAAPAPAPAAARGGDAAAPAAPVQEPWFDVTKPAQTSVAAFSKSGLAVTLTCTQAMRGSVTVTVSKKVAKSLRLKGTTLAADTVSCTTGSKSLRLKPSAAVKRALKNAKGSVKVTLGVSLGAAGKSAKKSTRTLTLGK